MADLIQSNSGSDDADLDVLLDDSRLLQQLLDDCLRDEVGPDLMSKLEQIRQLALSAHNLLQAGSDEAVTFLNEVLKKKLTSLSLEQIVPLARAFSHYLHLTSMAETFFQVRQHRGDDHSQKHLEDLFALLLAEGVTPDELFEAVSTQVVEIVLTAHPTQVNRRTLQYKQTRIAMLLQERQRADLTRREHDQMVEELMGEILSIWQTDELRRRKPTPLDEARGGLHLVEQSLWTAVPTFLRNVSAVLKKYTGRSLPVTATPLRFGSWMGGDRDGNPNVTAKITSDVTYLSRWMAADLYVRELDTLRFEMSMGFCSEELAAYSEKLAEAQATAEAETAAPAAPPGSAQQHTNTLSRLISTAADAEGGVAGMIIGTIPTELHGPTLQQNLSAVPRFSLQVPDAVPSPLDTGLPSPRPGLSVMELEPGTTSSTGSMNAGSTPASVSGSRPGTPPAGSSRHGPGSEKGSPMLSNLKKTSVNSTGSLGNLESKSIDNLLNPRRSFVTPYRLVLTDLRQKMVNTRKRMEDLLSGVRPTEAEYFETPDEFMEPLMMVYRSLHECGSGRVADGRFLDLLRRVSVFGMTLAKLDLRQESARHTEAMDAITKFLGMGSYAEWDEDTKIAFLIKELEGRRPLVPVNMPMPDNVREVLDTFRVATVLGSHHLGAYVISMASQVSDILLVELFQREMRLSVPQDQIPPKSKTLRVVPLFETVADLRNAGPVLRKLLSLPWYVAHLDAHHARNQEVMIGYSDSGKDAGRFSAAWELYKAQEEVVAVAQEFNVKLTLFHGRGGSVGRGGGPMYLAIQSQPPGSVQGRLRITEQGEMVQAKFGIPTVALTQFEVYTTAVLRASLHPPPPALNPVWRDEMERLAECSRRAYRSVVYEEPRFGDFFNEATPVAELANLNIGSRPTRRKASNPGDVRTLRAIPWIFAWTQTRFILPAWLGVGDALEEAFAQGRKGLLREMYQNWSFFASTVDLIEMILAKVDLRIAQLYDSVLVSERNKALGETLRAKFRKTQHFVLELSGHSQLLENSRMLRRLIELRSPNLEPINIMQVEILRRLRQDEANQKLRDALLITINGISAGMRNTG